MIIALGRFCRMETDIVYVLSLHNLASLARPSDNYKRTACGRLCMSVGAELPS